MNTSVPWSKLLGRAALSLVVAMVFWYYGKGFPNDRIIAVASLLATTAGVMLGFLLTAVTLLTAVIDRTLVSNMRKTGHYQRLVGESAISCGILLVTLIAAIVTLLLGGETLYLAFCISVGLSMMSLLQIVEAGHRFFLIFSLL